MSVLKIKDQNNDWIQIPTIKGDKGDPFTYADFTPEQLETLKGKDGISPTVSVVSDTSDDYRLSFTDETHTVTTPNLIPEAEKILSVYPHDTASGSIASFADGADGIPLKSCIVRVEPVQAGSGDPSPDNVRPITGWTGCEVQRTGKNLLNADTYYGDYKQSDGSYLLSASNLSIILIPLKTFIGKTVIFSADATIGETTNLRVRAFINGRSTNGTPATNNATSTISITATPVTDNDYIHITYGSGGSNPVTLRNVQLEDGSAVTTYESFGRTYHITFPTEAGTVYGGTLDVTNGVLTVDRAMVDLGTLNWSIGTTNTSGAYRYTANISTVVAESATTTPKMTCSQYATVTPIQTYARKNGISNNINIALITLYDEAFKDGDVATFKTAMNGVKLVYELATPITHQLTPTEIRSLLGQNNVFADTGDSTVEYRADTKLYIQKKIAEAVNALA